MIPMILENQIIRIKGITVQTGISGDTMVYIGKETDAIGRYFSGKLDDIGIWNHALTHTEISRLFDSNPSGGR